MSNRFRQKAIRVTLSFGNNSDFPLVRALREQRPYARAKLLHKLIREGLRSRLRDLGYGGAASMLRPDVTSDVPKRESTSSAPVEPLDISVPTDVETVQDAFSESVVDQLGKTVQ